MKIKATANAESRKNANVIDEIPMAYIDIDAVMIVQNELVEIVHQYCVSCFIDTLLLIKWKWKSKPLHQCGKQYYCVICF